MSKAQKGKAFIVYTNFDRKINVTRKDADPTPPRSAL